MTPSPAAGAAPTGTAASGPAASAGAQPTGPSECPHCHAPAPVGALFCENCGYDFTTGTAPTSSARFAAPGGAGAGAGAGAPVVPAPPQVSSLDLDPLSSPAAVATDPATGEPAEQGGEGEPGEGEPAAGEGEAAAAEGEAAPGEGEPVAGESANAEGEAGASSAVDPEATPSHGLPTPTVPGPDEWVAEVWIDPDWYREQAPEDPIPSVGMPLVVPLRSRSVLVGRPSRSRGINPEVDCGGDTGVSRRQCQLTTDGLRWWVEDLQSANGTYVSPVGESLPTSPIPVGARQELEEGMRIFVGGWTRIVVRRGIPGEI
ncbi:phosphopeptide-binding protein [Serinibacter arcticus]|uniref:Phosphopeptide-binding protein n=2 Tax=Serinibacter arcticus TaxID=1655435 RepID=A0A2U2A044_9MICO|nr:phosphopeptide-binding protein [Serinibacter arcticus]